MRMKAGYVLHGYSHVENGFDGTISINAEASPPEGRLLPDEVALVGAWG